MIHLNNNVNPEVNSQHEVAKTIKGKLMLYWAHLNDSSTVSGLLDPRNKSTTYELDEREQAINTLYQMYNKYRPAEENEPILPPITTKSARDLFCNLVNRRPISLNQNELKNYLTEPETEAEPLLWWKANSIQYPVLARMALDFLAVQATSVSSEQVFSVAKHTISLTRNRINPEVARASLCMKSWYTELGYVLKEE
jgi:hypothetical protein